MLRRWLWTALLLAALAASASAPSPTPAQRSTGISGCPGFGGSTGVSGCVSGGPSAITLVQKAPGAFVGGVSSATAAFTNNTIGDIGVIVVKWCVSTAQTATITTITDTATNTYTLLAASLASVVATHYALCNTEFAYDLSLKTFTGTNTVQVNFSSININGSITAYEIGPGLLDQQATGTNANTNLPQPGTLTTPLNGSFYIAAGILDNGFGSGSGWFTAGGPFTLGGEGGGANMNSADEYFAQTTAGAQAATFGTNFPATTGPNAGSVVTFKP